MMDASNLVWLDLEMTGLDADKERIIEAAMIVTDTNLNILAQSPVWVIHQSDALLAAMTFRPPASVQNNNNTA